MSCKKMMPALSGGIAGGIVFGAYMGYFDLLQNVARLAESESIVFGFVLHMIISVVLAFVFCATLGKRVAGRLGMGALYGLIFGAIWWFIGSLIITPLILEQGLNFSADIIKSSFIVLWGHLLYGLVLGLIYSSVRKN